MNDDQIENILQQAPRPKAPADLADKLKTDIRLTQTSKNMDATAWRSQPSWAKRWLPALSFAVVFLSCIIVLAIQTGTLRDLKQENLEIRAQGADLDSLRLANAEVQRLQNENAEHDRLKKDHAELERLRSEIATLHQQVSGLENLRAENQKLKSAINDRKADVATAPKEDQEDAKAKAESIHCINNLKQIGLAMRIWAGDNHDIYPIDFYSASNELSSFKVLQCPTDTAHTVSSWKDVAAGNISYIRVSTGPGAQDKFPDVVLAQCPIHGSVLLCDGSVQSGTNVQSHLKMVDGLLHFTQ